MSPLQPATASEQNKKPANCFPTIAQRPISEQTIHPARKKYDNTDLKYLLSLITFLKNNSNFGKKILSRNLSRQTTGLEPYSTLHTALN